MSVSDFGSMWRFAKQEGIVVIVVMLRDFYLPLLCSSRTCLLEEGQGQTKPRISSQADNFGRIVTNMNISRNITKAVS